jgi:hypothetical protein
MLPRYGVLLVLAAPALAQPGDPPARVARLNYETGPVSFRPGAVEDWTPAVPNYPLTAGDHLWTDFGGQAEMHVGSTAIRMKEQTALSLLNLDDRTVQLSLTQGTIHLRIRNLREDEIFEVDTPNASLALLRPGEYRIQTDGDSAVTTVALPGGEVEVTAGGTAFPVRARQSAQIIGPDGRSYNLVDMPPPDAFDRWCEDRDRREEQVQSVRYVPREMIGYEDLDQYGAWRSVPPYGWVWTPTTVVAGWAPYRYGHWVWVSPWGWTWVDDAPWGFAPFHYGRWAFADGVWLWVPGRVVERPIYAPALVAFVGGPRFSLSVSIGGGNGVAWFPLGPGEVYRPAYHVSEVYVRNVNVTHVNVTNINVTNVNVTNVRYVNQSVQGAVTAVPQQAFVSARPVGQVATVVSARDAAQAQVVGTTAAVSPRPESIVRRPANVSAVSRPPAQIVERPVAVRTAPPPPPVSFRAQQQALEANPGQPLDANTLGNLRGTAGATPNAPRYRTVNPGNVTSAPPPPRPPIRTEREISPPTPARNDRPPTLPQVQQVNPPPRPPVRTEREIPAATAPQPPIRTEREIPPPTPARNDRPPTAPQVNPLPRPPVRTEREIPAPTAPQPPIRTEREIPPPTPARNDRPAAAAPERRPPPQEQRQQERREQRKEERRDERREKQ